MNFPLPQAFRQSNPLSRKKIIHFSDNRYTVKLADTYAEIDEALRLRFEVFNLELREGLDSSYLTFRDEDAFDAQCNHLIVVEKSTQRVIGTYRLQTFEMSRSGQGFYSDTEFFLPMLGKPLLRRSVELGRACIAAEHRNGRVLFLLWKGIWQYLEIKEKRYLFGCCSLTSRDPKEGNLLFAWLDSMNYVNRDRIILPKPDFVCLSPRVTSESAPVMPPLMSLYFRYGAKICSYPAIDREFGTIDYLMVMDIDNVRAEVREQFSQSTPIRENRNPGFRFPG